jgi:dTDP-glucose 4,6-dehydratase
VTRTILVTGVGGFVGSHVVEALLERTDWHVVGVDSFRHNGDFVNLVDVAGHDTSRVGVVVHDLTVPFTARRLREVIDLDVDYVINVASRSHVDESVHEPVDFVMNNVQLGLNVLELCRVIKPRRLVHVSTDEVYGPRGGAITEHRPSSPYAASKAAQADLIWAYARTYDVRASVVVSANMFGERQCGTAYVPLVVRALLAGRELDVHYAGDQPGERSYTYVGNVAHRIVDELMVDAERDQLGSGSVDYVTLTGQRRVDNLTLASRISNIAGLPLQVRVVQGAASRPGYDPTYATLDDVWTPRVDFDEGLRRTVRWGLNHYGDPDDR